MILVRFPLEKHKAYMYNKLKDGENTLEYIKTNLETSLNIDGIYTIHYFEYTKDFSYSGEFHNFWEIVYADKKRVVITADSTELTLEAGQLYIHQPNEFHKIRCDGTRAANSVVISFDCDCPELFSASGKVINCNTEEKQLLGMIVHEASEAFSNPLGSPYTVKMEKAQTTKFAAEQIIRTCIELLLISIVRGNISEEPDNIEKQNTLLMEICEYLESNTDKPLMFDDIRKHFNVSASVIKRLFKSTLGCGIMEHFLHLKIDNAKQLIRETEMNFTEISEYLAFSSPQYFSSAFRRVSGMTPSEYAHSVKLNFR